MNLSSPSSITIDVPPSLDVANSPATALLSSGPGVLIPNTELGTSLLALEVVSPLVSSAVRPCVSNTALNKILIGFLILSGLVTVVSLFLILLCSPTGNFLPIRLASSVSVIVVAGRPSGSIKFIVACCTQPIQNALLIFPSTNITNTLFPMSGGTNHIP